MADEQFFVEPPATTPPMFGEAPTSKVGSPYTNKGTERVSTLGAIAGKWNTDSEQTLDEAMAIITERLDKGEDDRLRNEISQNSKAERITATQKAQSDVMRGRLLDTYPVDTTLSQLVNHELSIQMEPDNPNDLEKAGVSGLSDMARSDAHQAAAISTDSVDRAVGNSQKMSIFARELDKLQKEREEQGLFGHVADFFRIPLQNLGQLPGNALTDLPSTRLQQMANELWDPNMSVAEFEKKLPEVVKTLRSTSGWFSENLSLTLETLAQLGGITEEDKLNYDVWTGVDAASLHGSIPIGKAVKLIGNPSALLHLIGDRKGAANLTASKLMKDAHQLDKGVGVPDIQGATGAIEESLPSHVKPNTSDLVRPYVGVSSDVADKIDAITYASQRVPLETPVSRLEPEQVTEAVNKAIKDFEVRFKDENIADVKSYTDPLTPEGRRMITAFERNEELENARLDLRPLDAMRKERLSPPPENEIGVDKASGLNTVSVYLGRKAGSGGYATEEGAIQAAKDRGIPIQRSVVEWGSVPVEFQEAAKQISLPSGSIHKHVDTTGLWFVDGDKPVWYWNGKNPEQILGDEAAKKLNKFEVVQGDHGERVWYKPGEKQRALDILALSKRKYAKEIDQKEYNVLVGPLLGFKNKVSDPSEFVSIHRNVDGQYFIKYTDFVREDGVITPFIKENEFPIVGTTSQYFKKPDSSTPEVWHDARLAGQLEKGRVQNTYYKPLLNEIKKLNGKQNKSVQKVLALGQSDEHKEWFTLPKFQEHFERLNGYTPSDKEVVAYYAYKNASDLNHEVFNNYVFTEKARRGWKTGSAKAGTFDTGRVNVRPLTSPDFNGVRIYDAEDGLNYFGTQGEVNALKSKWDTGNYHVFELEQAHMMPGKDPVKYALVHKRSATLGPLERNQLGYVQGGSREYAHKVFVKQAQKGAFQDGKEYYLSPKTWISARTTREGNEWAARMNRAIDAWNADPIGRTTIIINGKKVSWEMQKRQIIESSPIGSYDKWADMVAKGELNVNSRFEAVYDRALPSEMTKLGEDTTNWGNVEQTGLEQYFESKGRMYYSKKVEQLKDPDGNKADLLDPYRTLQRSINNAINTHSLADYNRKIVDEWVRVARPYLASPSPDNYTAFYQGAWKPDFVKSKPLLYSQLEGNRMIHKRFLGMRDSMLTPRELATRRLAEWVQGKGKLGNWAAGKILDTQSRNPVDAIQGMVFDSYMGFYDPGQFIVQTQTALAAIATHPKHGLQAAAMNLPFTWALVNGSDNVIDYIAKGTKLIHGLDPKEWKLMVKTYQNQGWAHVAGSFTQLDYMSTKVGGSAISKGASAFRQGGRFLFNLSERFNRMTAFQIAWKQAKENFPQFQVGSDGFLSKVRVITDDLTQNMTGASKAGWQQGLAGVPTKFFSYQTHLLENMLPKTFGGNPRNALKPGQNILQSQKLRLAMSQVLFYGAAGVAGGPAVAEFVYGAYERATGKQMDNTTYRAVSKGLFDTLFHELSGGELNTNFAARVGTGGAWADLWDKVSNGDLNSALEVAGGAAGAVTSNFIDAGTKLARYFQAEQVNNLSAEEWGLMANDMFSTIKSFSRASKAYTIWKTGYLKNPKTGRPITSATQMEGWAALLGIPLYEETARFDAIGSMKNREALVKDFGTEIARNRRLAFEAYAKHDDKSGKNYERAATALMMLFRDDFPMQKQISEFATKDLGYTETDWDSLMQRMMETTGKLPLGAGN